MSEPIAIIDNREVHDIELDALVGAAIGHPGRIEYRACPHGRDDSVAFWSGHRGEVQEFVAKYSHVYALRQATVFPRYSSNMEQAWWVVEMLTGSLPSIVYRCGIFTDDPGRMGWFVDFRAGERSFAAASTPSLAICLAALLVTGKAKEAKARA